KRGDMMDIDDIIDILSVELLGVVPEDEMIIVSTNKGEPAVLDNNSRAGGAYRRIARRIMGEEVPLFQGDEAGNLVERFKKMIKLAR
ncbi:MAG: septum site-determining protein MinD, partial [Syntrophomonadaceae bacterium]|nr:septum site-determining protein MinD [Syntrophomonadaceae bacterium]